MADQQSFSLARFYSLNMFRSRTVITTQKLLKQSVPNDESPIKEKVTKV